MHLEVEFGDAPLHVLLRVGHGVVVDRRADLVQEEGQQRAGRDVADRLSSMFCSK